MGQAPPAQSARAGGGPPARAKKPSEPTPRWPDGHPMLSAAPGQLGYWDAGFGGMNGKRPPNLPTNIDISEVPFQPWAKALYEARQKTQSRTDPHARCLAPGGPRQFHTPYGLMIYEIPEAKRIFVISGGGPRSWRVIYMDGRPHPTGDNLSPSYFGHSVGHWEGDVLVIDSVGFNEKFWMSRSGLPHTDALHLIEHISRPDYNTLKYEATIDDPKAYTAQWSGGWTIPWTAGEDFDEYFCQDNNRDAEHLVGPQ
jgi:hypothetical protein